MITVSISQARTRIKTLPEHIKDVVFAERTADSIHEIAVTNHIPSEKVPQLAMAASLALLGFLHVEDIDKEIRDRLSVNGEVAKTLAEELLKKIFRPIKNDLDALYAPPAAEPKEKPEVPRISIPVVSEKPAETTIASSKIAEGDARQATNAPAPFILHEEAEAKPIEKPSEFKFELKKEFFQKQVAPTAPPPRPPKPATIEIGGVTETKKESQIARTTTETPRVVHYSEMRTPVKISDSQFPISNESSILKSSAGRQTVQPAIPIPIPPRPKKPEKPSQPSSEIKPASPQPPSKPETREGAEAGIVDLSSLTVKKDGVPFDAARDK